MWHQAEQLEGESGRERLDTIGGRAWLDTSGGHEWLGTSAGRAWLSACEGPSFEWLDTESGHKWLQTKKGKEWLDTEEGRSLVPWDWLGKQSGEGWLQSEGGGQWLQSIHGFEWLNDGNGLAWLGTQNGKQWLKSVRDWLQTPEGQRYSTAETSFWFNMQEYLDTVQAITEFAVIPHFSLLPAFQAIQQFKSLPDFLMFPAFLALTPQYRTPDQPEEIPDMDDQIIHAMKAFVSFTVEARERSQSSSGALSYACQNWAKHLSQALDPWDDKLDCLFKVFCNDHLLSWLERLWCLKGLRSCLPVLSEAQTVIAKKHLHTPGSSGTPEPEPMQDVIAH